MQKTTISRKALEYTLLKDNRQGDGRIRMKQEKAFTAGIEAIMAILESESSRLVDNIERGVMSEFEKGQIDGICWLRDAVKMETGANNEK